jgi:hypothetical protein
MKRRSLAGTSAVIQKKKKAAAAANTKGGMKKKKEPANKKRKADAADAEEGVKKKKKQKKPAVADTKEGEARWRDYIPLHPNDISNTLRAWRDALALLDIAVPHSVNIKGKWKSLEDKDMRACYERRRDHMMGEVVMADWFNALPLHVDDSLLAEEAGVAIYFWHCPRGVKRCLPRNQEAGIRSADQHANFSRIKVVTYQKDLELPDFSRNC